MLVLLFFKQVFFCLVHRLPFEKTVIAKGFSLYKKEQRANKKGLLRVIYEIDRLASFHRAWPDSYFRMGMFMKSWDDMVRMKSFIPQDAYERYAEDKDKRYHLLIDDKILFHDILSYYGIALPCRFFVFRNGEFRRGKVILEDEMVDEILSGVEDKRIFVKRYTGGASSGISVFSKGKDGFFYDAEGIQVSADMIRKKYRGKDYIFEKQIKQVGVLAEFNPDTVNTIRVLTFCNRIISATVRFGGKGEYVDNVSAHGVACSLDINTGKLGEYALRMYDVNRYYEHPDSHKKFAGVYVSQWSEVKRLVEKALIYLPYYKSVGFDIATSDQGPLIVEINTGAGINLSQMGKDIGLMSVFSSSNE